MKSWFQARGYPKHLVQKEISKVQFNKENSNTKQSKSKRVIFVVTYHPLLKSSQSLINKHLNILYLDENAEAFIPGTMVTFRSSRKLSGYLVRAKSYPLARVTGSCKRYKKRFAVCLNVSETSTFISSLTHQTNKINYELHKSVTAHVLLANVLLQRSKQHVGQTIDNFRFQWNTDNNRKYHRSETCMQDHLFRHCSSPGHYGFSNDVSITFIDKADPSDPLKREDYWRRTLKTMAPFGLKIEDSV